MLKKLFNYFKNINKPNKCINHPERDAINFCHGCKKYLCKSCLIEGPRYYYCNSESCLKLYYQEVDFSKNPRFCSKCLSETLDESSGDIISVNFIGDKFICEGGEECSVCGSEVVEKIGPIVGRKGSYRVIWLDSDRTKFISRKLKNATNLL